MNAILDRLVSCSGSVHNLSSASDKSWVRCKLSDSKALDTEAGACCSQSWP